MSEVCMPNLYFKVINCSDTAHILLSMEEITSISGDMDYHGGVIAQIQGKSGGILTWYILPQRRDDVNGSGLLTLTWCDEKPPGSHIMFKIFNILDNVGVKAEFTGTHYFDISEYPSWLEYSQ